MRDSGSHATVCKNTGRTHFVNAGAAFLNLWVATSTGSHIGYLHCDSQQ